MAESLAGGGGQLESPCSVARSAVPVGLYDWILTGTTRGRRAQLEELKHSAAVYARLCDSLDVPHDHRSTTAMQPQQSAIWVNGSHPAPPSMEPDADALKELGRFYYPHNLRLFEWLGRDLDWHHASHYAHAATASKSAAG